MARLSKSGYEKINNINEKYKISCFEVTSMEEYDEWKDDFWRIFYTSDIIDIEDAKYVYSIDIKLGYSVKGDRNL
jgi:hypothetical protein